MRIMERQVTPNTRRRLDITREGITISVRRSRAISGNRSREFYTSERLTIPWRRTKFRNEKTGKFVGVSEKVS